MTTSLHGALVLVVAAVAGSAVGASEYSTDQIREIAGRYAICVIKDSPKSARRFVLDEDRDPPIIGQCLNQAARFSGGQMRFPAEMYGYGLAEALLVHDYGQGLPNGVATAPAIARDPIDPIDPAALPHDARRAAAIRERHDRREGFRAMDLVTECVARRAPADSYALIRSALASAAETAAFDRLKPSLAACISSQQTVRMNRSVLRGSLAANLYRLAYSIQPVSGRGA